MKVYAIKIIHNYPNDYFSGDDYDIGDVFVSYEMAKEFVKSYSKKKNRDFKVIADDECYYAVGFDVYEDEYDMNASERIVIEVVERELIQEGI